MSPFNLIQGHRFWYQSKAHNLYDLFFLTSYLALSRSYSIPNVRNRYISLPLLRLNSPTEPRRGSLGTISVKFQLMSMDGQGTRRRRKIAENISTG